MKPPAPPSCAPLRPDSISWPLTLGSSPHAQGRPGVATTGSAVTTDFPPLGLDLAKLKFNACLVRAGGRLRHKVFPDTEAGFAQLSDWLESQGAGRLHAGVEATGTYGDAPAAYIHEAGHTASRVNPAAIKAYAQSRLSRTKDDRVDAALLAGFRAGRRPPAWQPPASGLRELQAPVRRLDSLVEMRAMEENRPPLIGHRRGGRPRVSRGVARPPHGAG